VVSDNTLSNLALLEQSEFFYLLLVVMDLPLEYAFIVRADRQEEQLVV